MTELDDLIRVGLLRRRDHADDADWADVVARSRRARRRRRVIAAAVFAAVVAAGTATAIVLDHPIVNFGSAKRGPHSIVVEFGRLDVEAPPRMGPNVLPRQARRITTVTFSDGRKHTLWVAPTRNGGFCALWTGGFGGCRANPGSPRLDLTTETNRVGATSVGGSFFQPNGDRLEVRYADGASSEIPFVRVTKPIGAAFYLFEIPDAHRRRGHQAVEVALYDSGGSRLAGARVPGGEPPDRVARVAGFAPLLLPREAVYVRRRMLFDLRVDGRRIGLWVAPSRLGGRCYWSNRAARCDRGHRLVVPRLLGLGLLGGRDVLLCCEAGRRIAWVELRFQDGDHYALRPREGLLLALLPHRHYAPGRRLSRLVGYDRAGRVIASRAIPTSRGVYPCKKPRQLRYGVKMCP